MKLYTLKEPLNGAVDVLNGRVVTIRNVDKCALISDAATGKLLWRTSQIKSMAFDADWNMTLTTQNSLYEFVNIMNIIPTSRTKSNTPPLQHGGTLTMNTVEISKWMKKREPSILGSLFFVFV